MLRKFGAVLLAALLVGCASGEYSGSTGKTVLVSKEVWGWYQEYLAKINGVNKGVYVVGLDKGVAVVGSSVYCPGSSCMNGNYSKQALDACRSYGADIECIVFANGSYIMVNYKVEGQ